MVSKRNPKQEARAAAEKALAAAAKKKAAAEAKAAAAAKKAQLKEAKSAAKQADQAKSSAAKPAPAKAPAAAKAHPAAAAKAKPPAKAKTPKRRRWPLRVVLVVVALAVVAAGAFSWNRWLRYDDAKDFQGTWSIDGSAKGAVIDGSTIKLTDDVKFSYHIDPFAKTIAFSFGNNSNTGRYRFSADRKQLVITEGSSYTALSTLFEDLAADWQALTRAVRGEQPLQPQEGAGVTVFGKEPSDKALPASSPSAKPPASKPDAPSSADDPSFKEPLPTPEPGGSADG